MKVNGKREIIIYPSGSILIDGRTGSSEALAHLGINLDDFKHIPYRADEAIRYNTPTATIVLFPDPCTRHQATPEEIEKIRSARRARTQTAIDMTVKRYHELKSKSPLLMHHAICRQLALEMDRSLQTILDRCRLRGITARQYKWAWQEQTEAGG